MTKAGDGFDGLEQNHSVSIGVVNYTVQQILVD